jgi:hypothetical protein
MKWVLLGGIREAIRISSYYHLGASGNVVVYLESDYKKYFGTDDNIRNYKEILSADTFENLLKQIYKYSGTKRFKLYYGSHCKVFRKPGAYFRYTARYRTYRKKPEFHYR